MVGKLCEKCGQAIFSPEVGQGPQALKAVADRTGDVLRVTCTHCQFRNEFPQLDMVRFLLCHECGEPVSVEEPVQ